MWGWGAPEGREQTVGKGREGGEKAPEHHRGFLCVPPGLFFFPSPVELSPPDISDRAAVLLTA